MTETRHYQHPGKPITTPEVETRTHYGNTTPILVATGTRDALKRLEKRHDLKRIYPLEWRTF